MATGQKIRVIKQSERLSAREEIKPSANVKASADPSRTVKTTVSTWIRDFQQQQVRDTRRAFNSLFKDSKLQTA